MIEYLKTWAELKYDRRAVTALEYGLIAAALIGIVATAFGYFGTALESFFNTKVSTALNGPPA